MGGGDAPSTVEGEACSDHNGDGSVVPEAPVGGSVAGDASGGDVNIRWSINWSNFSRIALARSRSLGVRASMHPSTQLRTSGVIPSSNALQRSLNLL